MNVWVPDELFKDKENIDKVYEIINKVPETCIRIIGEKTLTLDDVIPEVEALGEHKVAEHLKHCCYGG